MQEGQKVRYQDRVGNVVATNGDRVTVVMPNLTPHPDGISMVAGIEQIDVEASALETEWLEGPDEHERFWDELGRQVIFQPDGSKKIVDHTAAAT